MSDQLRQERLARVALSQVFEPGDYRLSALVRQLDAVGVAEELRRQAQDGVEPEVAQRLEAVNAEGLLAQGEALGIRYVIPGDAEWPAQLDDLDRLSATAERSGQPLGLWVRGAARLDQLERSVAIVGSRSATTYGADVAAQIGAETARAGFTVISGAAFGIDQAAHRGALAVDGRTVAVLACGADRVYPAAHAALLMALVKEGAVVTELAPGEYPTKGRFLSRNRVIAALTRGTVVVEAAARSGALSTARWAAHLNRPLMGVPGPVTSASSVGVHQLLRESGAVLVTDGNDVLELVGSAGEFAPTQTRTPVRRRDRLPIGHQRLLDAFELDRALSVDELATRARMGLVEVSASIDQLRRGGWVTLHDDGWRLTEQAIPGMQAAPSP